MHMLMSPRREVPSMVVFPTPPNNINKTPRFTSSLPGRVEEDEEVKGK